MKRLHHPTTPCKRRINQDLDLKISDLKKPLEAVRCSEGFGIFGEDNNFWISDREFTENQHLFSAIYTGERFEDYGWFFYTPISLEIELTRDCNQRCIHCWNESSKQGNFPFEKAVNLINEFRSNGGQTIKIVGGEPLTYPFFFEFIEEASLIGIKNIQTITNGALVNSQNAKTLSKNLRDIRISIHGSTPKIHDGITLNPGSYRNALNSINFLQDSGLNPRLNYTVMPRNVSDVLSMIELASQLKVKSLKFNLLKNVGRARNLPEVSEKQFHEIRNLIYESSKETDLDLEKSELFPSGYNIGLNEAKFYGCSGLRSLVYIDFTGNVYPCSLIRKSIGNIYNDSLFNLWRNNPSRGFRRQFNCLEDKCSLRLVCSGKCKV